MISRFPSTTTLFLATALALAPFAARADSAAFDRFVRAQAQQCLVQPSTQCFAEGFAYVDRDQDGGVSLDEADLLRTTVEDWIEAEGASIPKSDRSAVLLGLWIVNLGGLDQIHRDFDVDGDGLVAKSELEPLMALDERPITEVVQDPDAVDWQALAARLGAASALLGPLRRDG